MARKFKSGPCHARCGMHHVRAAAARKHRAIIMRDMARVIVITPAMRKAFLRRGKSCRHRGEYKPGGGRYAKKTCVPRKRSRKRHRAGQFKPGGGRYVTTTGGRKTKKRKSVRGSAESMSIF